MISICSGGFEASFCVVNIYSKYALSEKSVMWDHLILHRGSLKGEYGLFWRTLIPSFLEVR